MIFEATNHCIGPTNQARNPMIYLGGGEGATYILHWDGNCFSNDEAWTDITSVTINSSNNSPVESLSSTRYFYVNDDGKNMLKTDDCCELHVV